METIKFKTTIKCAGCVAKVTTNLNETAGEGNWEVDINDPSKILTVSNDVEEEAIKAAVEKAGFKAERVS